MNNPLTTGKQFQLEMMNPNPSSKMTKDGPKYFCKFEILKEAHEMFMTAELAGMIIAGVCKVTEPKGDGITDDTVAVQVHCCPPKEKKPLPTAADVLGIMRDDWKPPKNKNQPLRLSNECAMWCKTPKFWEFLNKHFQVDDTDLIDSEDRAKGLVYKLLGIGSRAVIDMGGKGTAAYIKIIQTPYREWVNRA